MATHSSTPAWKIPWMEEPGRPQSMGSQSNMTEQLHFLIRYGTLECRETLGCRYKWGIIII